ncbi:protein REDUCED WALL ACETYLATION 1 isoform X2 [Nematostella vectensis]|uniref:protein REDUCED WALL ACETYLATION 1 isoform X2 n=1 Tax=Nematostella vectensis TaxID=45351 RepID=UPI0020773412|nr:protein REDUCED WALL ACETYLATION 1 isoform X2 [Nematostella vectensis]
MGGALTTDDPGKLDYRKRSIYLSNVETYGWISPVRPITIHQKALFCLWITMATGWLILRMLALREKWKSKEPKDAESDPVPDSPHEDKEEGLVSLNPVTPTKAPCVSRFGRGDATEVSETIQHIASSEDAKPWLKKGETLIEWLKETGPDQPRLEEFLAKATVFGFIMLYFWLCDFQHIWPKTDKQYSRDMFVFLFSVLVLVAFVFTVRKTPEKLLNRDQTEEWKGWMQEVFNSIRCYIGAYVWMTGFGNFSYFWIKKDYSIFRLLKMMFRLNFLVVMVMAVTNHEFVRYYICAMHTYWFLSVYVMMAVGKQHNANRKVMAAKFIIYLVFNLLIFDVPGASWKIFWPFQFILNVKGNLRYWIFRSTLDHLATWVGMLCAYNYPYLERLLSWLDRSHESDREKHRAWLLKGAITLIVLGAVTLWSHYILMLDRKTYMVIHPFTSWIPILGYIWLRNCFPYLRKTYLNLFAWLGKITLETYLSQIHIYMIADAQKQVVYIPRYPMLNFLLSTVIYVALSYVLFHKTLFFNSYIFPKNMRVVCKNLILGSLWLGACYLFAFVLTSAHVW